VALEPDVRPHQDLEPLRVLIAEGQGLVRAGFRGLLDAQADMSAAAEAATADEAVAAARAIRPDVALIDLGLPGGGLEATRRILAEAEDAATRVVILIGSRSDKAVLDALRAGATGLLLRDAGPDDLIESVRVVAAGQAMLPPSLAGCVVADFLSRPERLSSTPEQLEELTPRECEVVALVASGLSNEEIAERLVVTRATVKTHVSRALYKLHARDRAQLVVMAYEAGLVRPRPRQVGAAGRPVPFAGIGHAPAKGSLRRPSLRPVAA
jgi:DNA-binding NarL/FixJ family response regulator